MYDTAKAKAEVNRYTGGTGSAQVRRRPAVERASPAFYTRRINGETGRAGDLLAAYRRIPDANSKPFLASGIWLTDQNYLIPDKAVMKTAMALGWTRLVAGEFI
jgi:hypothetical protein